MALCGLSNLELVASFLSASERLSLALTHKALLDNIRPYLNSAFDVKVAYLNFRRGLTASLQQRKKKQAMLRPVRAFGEDFGSLKSTRGKLASCVFGLKYTKKDFDISECKVTLQNEYGDLLILQGSLLEDVEPETGEEFKCLAEASELNAIDFTNPAMLLKRQQRLLEKLHSYRSSRQDNEDLQALKYLREPGVWVVILCHGGHFCFTAYSGDGVCLKHTTDHKYVSRKKQGGRQISKDGKSGGKINSTGSQIRRENERIHQEHIVEILEENDVHLASADLIFIVAPGLNRIILTKEPSPLAKYLHKVRSAGVSIGKANFAETSRVYELLEGVELCVKTNML
jgi:hypothetical protein